MKRRLILFCIPVLLMLSACSTTVPAPPQPKWGSLVPINKTVPVEALNSRGAK